MSSPHSTAKSAERDLGEREEHLLEPALGQPGAGAQLRERALAGYPAAGEQHETVADPPGVGELMDRDEERSALARRAAKDLFHFAGLPQVEAVEGFVEQEDRPRDSQTEDEEETPPLALGKGADVFRQEAREPQGRREASEPCGVRVEEA